MRQRFLFIVLVLATIVLAGCYEYRIDVTVAADGTGTRTVTLDTRSPLDADERRLAGVDGDRWRILEDPTAEGDEPHRYRRVQTVNQPGDWPRAGGVLMRGALEGKVVLASEVAMEEVRSGKKVEHVYRETLYWWGLDEEVAASVATSYAAFLRREFPDLPDSLVHESRGAMAATIILNWSELAADDSTSSREAELGDRFNYMIGQRLLRAGVPGDLVQRLVRATADWGYFDSLPEDLPGLEDCAESSLTLHVTMPGPITGGNADTVEGNTATFQLDLARTMAGPVTLEVVSGP